jgi:hypothetical protein
MCIFEVTSAILTIVRILQAMKAIGPWRLQKASLNYLLFEQGKEMLSPRAAPPEQFLY